ncbi:MAG: hypothetical protein ACXWP1_05940 [Bdellovibrionota bacterium]
MKSVFLMLVAAFALASVAQAETCREGETHSWPSQNPALQGGEAGPANVTWTCKGGVFVENGYTAPAPKTNTCREGESYYWPSQNPALQGGEAGPQNVLWTCKGGVFVENGYTARRRGHIVRNHK